MRYLVVVDADSILYTSCYNNQKAVGEEIKLHKEGAYLDFCSKVGSLRSMVYSDNEINKKEDTIDYEIVFSTKHTFRHNMYPDYKGKRKPSTIVGIGELKRMVVDRLGATEVEDLEADDIVITRAYEYEDNDEVTVYIGAIDKDVIDHSPVKTINYNKWELKDGLDEDAIELGYYCQSILGDSTDNIKGAKGKGKKFVENYYEENLFASDEKRYNAWIEAFKGNVEEAILNMRLVRLDQYKNGRIVLWNK